MECINYSFFRVTRDADLELKELEADDLLLAVEQSLQKRRLGALVVRLEGTKVEEGKKIMKDSGLDIIAANNLSDAARKIVSSIKENS